jgi:hypothetical protein
VANGSLACTTNTAIIIVKIIGSMESLYRKPVMKARVQNTSAKMAKEREMVLLSPITLGKLPESAPKFTSFCKPWVRNILPKRILPKRSIAESQKLL